MRWVVLTDDHPPLDGGVATFASWATAALRSEHQVRVFARMRSGLPSGVRGVAGPSFGRWGPVWMAAAAAPAIRRADAIVCTTWPLARYVRRLAGHRPLHVVAHGSDVCRPPAGPMQDVFAAASGRWAVSRHLVEVLARKNIDARVLPLPVPVIPAADADADRWLFIGRAVHHKGGDRFIRLVAAAGASADVVGDGPELPVWKSLAAQLGARVRFHGRLDRRGVDRVRARARKVFLLSRDQPGGGEGLGLTLIEARAAGVAVVGSGVGGIPEAVGRGLVLDDPDRVTDSLAALNAHAVVDNPLDQHGVRAFLDCLCR